MARAFALVLLLVAAPGCGGPSGPALRLAVPTEGRIHALAPAARAGLPSARTPYGDVHL